MKQSILTGKFIYERLNKLYTELKQIGEACDMVSDDIGQGSVAYKILNDSYNGKKIEITKYEEEKFPGAL
jgi:hypothetical protein